MKIVYIIKMLPGHKKSRISIDKRAITWYDMLLWYCAQKQHDPTADKNLQELRFVFQKCFTSSIRKRRTGLYIF